MWLTFSETRVQARQTTNDMAKSINEYYDLIVQIKEGNSELAGLTPLNDSSQQYMNDNASGSRLAIWRMWAYIMAVLAWLLDTMFDRHKLEVDAIARTVPYATPRWFHQIALAYQHGDALQWDGHRLFYPTPDPAKRIVKRAAIVYVNGILQVKVASLVNDAITPLQPHEVNAFSQYMKAFMYPGTVFTVISQPADEMKLSAEIYYNPLVLNPDGSKVAEPDTFPVTEAIKGYISDLPFNGRMNLQKLVDAIQAVDGVEDIKLNNVQARYGDLPFNSVLREYIPFAGHMYLNTTESQIEYKRYE